MSCPCAVAVADPESERVVVLFEALLATVSAALNVPAAFGLNMTLIVVLWPDATVTGRLGAVREKNLVETAALLIVRSAVPEFVAVNVAVLLLPAVTLPKFRVVTDVERVPDCWFEPTTLKPWQPTRKVRLARRNSAAAALPNSFAEVALAKVFSMLSHGTMAPGSTTACCPGGGFIMSLR